MRGQKPPAGPAPAVAERKAVGGGCLALQLDSRLCSGGSAGGARDTRERPPSSPAGPAPPPRAAHLAVHARGADLGAQAVQGGHQAQQVRQRACSTAQTPMVRARCCGDAHSSAPPPAALLPLLPSSKPQAHPRRAEGQPPVPAPRAAPPRAGRGRRRAGGRARHRRRAAGLRKEVQGRSSKLNTGPSGPGWCAACPQQAAHAGSTASQLQPGAGSGTCVPPTLAADGDDVAQRGTAALGGQVDLIVQIEREARQAGPAAQKGGWGGCDMLRRRSERRRLPQARLGRGRSLHFRRARRHHGRQAGARGAQI